MPSMRSASTALVFQAACVHAFWLGIKVVIGYRALELGAGPAYLGLLATAFAVPALLTSIPVGRVTDRLGGAGAASVGLLVNVGGTVLALLGRDTTTLLVAALVMGLGQQVVMVGQQTFVAHAGAGSEAAFGTLTAASSIGQAVGPPVATAALALVTGALSGTDAALLACLAFLLPALGAAPPLIRRDRVVQAARTDSRASATTSRQLLAIPGMWRSLVVSGAVLVTLDLLYAFIPVWATEQGVDPHTVGLLLALRAVVSLVSRVGLSRLVARFGRGPLILVSCLAGAAALVALPLSGVAGAVVAMVGLGVALGLPQPLTMAWVTALSPPSAHGAALGLRLTANRLAQVSLPALVGVTLGSFGVVGVFWANALLLTAAVTGLIGRGGRG